MIDRNKRKGMISSEMGGVAGSMIPQEQLQQQQRVAQPTPQPQQRQGSTKDFATMMAGKVAQKYIAPKVTGAVGGAVGGPAGYVAGEAVGHFAPQLIGAFFRHGGHVRYYLNGAAGEVPMMMSDPLPPPGAEKVEGVPQEVAKMADAAINGQMGLERFKQILMSMNVPSQIVKDVVEFVAEEKQKVMMKNQQGGSYGS